MRILLTGAAGLLGTWLRRTAPSGLSLVLGVHSTPIGPSGPDRGTPQQVRADLCDAGQVERAVALADPDLVLHAAYRRDERSVVTATDNVASATAGHGAALVMISTDAVFAGDGRARTESEPPDPVWDYGRWKALAERRCRTAVPHATVIRVPVLVSFDPPAPMVRDVWAAVERGRPMVWNRGELRQAAWASEVAEAIWRIVGLPPEVRAGVWHLPGARSEARVALGRWVAARLGVADPGIEGDPPSDEEWPRDLRLADDRARRTIGWDPTPVIDARSVARAG